MWSHERVESFLRNFLKLDYRYFVTVQRNIEVYKYVYNHIAYSDMFSVIRRKISFRDPLNDKYRILQIRWLR